MKGKSPPLAKITRPVLSVVFPRERMFRLLDDWVKRPVTWVSGPGGSGKTTLVASWLESRGLPCLWYTIDEGDADIATFFYYMGLAVKKAAPRFRKPLPLLTSEYLRGIQIFAQRYFEELFKRLRPPFAIILDNYQEVPDEPGFHEIINICLSTVPEGINVVVISRNEPPPAFIRLRANNGMTFVGWKDLRLTAEESKGIVRMKEKRKVPGETLSLLHKKTEGWLAGLVLLIESSRINQLDYRLLERLTPQEIFAYFANEIFRKADREIREFLLKTAFLPSMTVGMANTLTGMGRADRILSRLYDNNYFTERHLKEDPVYLYHPLFREFLLSRAKETLAHDEIVRVQRSAAALLMESGHMEEAAGLLLDAGDWSGLTQLIFSHAQSLLSQGRNKTLEEWIDRIPNEIMESVPWLLYWKGVCVSPSNPAGGRFCLERAFQLFESAGDEIGVLSAWSAIVSTILIGFDSRKLLDTWINWMDERISRRGSFPSPVIEASVANGMAAALVWRMPNHPDIQKWLHISSSLLQRTRNANCLYSNLCIAMYCLFMGKSAECALLVEEMRKIKSASPLVNITLKLAEATACCSSVDSLGKAGRALSEGLDLARRSGVHVLAPAYFWVGMTCSMVSGNLKAARELLSEYENRGPLPHMLSCHVAFFSAWYELAVADLHQAALRARHALQLVEELGEPIYGAYTRLLLAHVLQETGDYAESRRQLAAAGEITSRTGSPLLDYLYHMTESFTAFEQKDHGTGVEALRKALIKGRSCGYSALTYYWRPAILGRLCATALDAEIEVDYVRNLIKKFSLLPDVPFAGSERWPWPIKVYTLGGFEVIRDGKHLEFPVKAPRKIISLLKAIVAFGRNGASEEQLVDQLWPDTDGDTAHRSFSTGIHRLRQLLGNERALQVRDSRVRLDAGYCWVDAHSFEELLLEAEGRPSDDREGLMEKAVSFYRGSFLEGAVELWALSYRERLRHKFLRAVRQLGEWYEGATRFHQAVELYQKGLEIDDLAEELYYRMMKSYQAAGRRAEAMAVFDRCKKTLKATLGVEPSPATQELFRAIKACP